MSFDTKKKQDKAYFCKCKIIDSIYLKLAAIPGVARENPIRYELEKIEILNLRKHPKCERVCKKKSLVFFKYVFVCA